MIGYKEYKAHRLRAVSRKDATDIILKLSSLLDALTPFGTVNLPEINQFFFRGLKLPFVLLTT